MHAARANVTAWRYMLLYSSSVISYVLSLWTSRPGSAIDVSRGNTKLTYIKKRACISIIRTSERVDVYTMHACSLFYSSCITRGLLAYGTSRREQADATAGERGTEGVGDTFRNKYPLVFHLFTYECSIHGIIRTYW